MSRSVMSVESWYDQGVRLEVDHTVESWYDQGLRLSVDSSVQASPGQAARVNRPSGMSESAAAASPQLVEEALAYEADVAEMRARLEAFPEDAKGTMVGLLRAKLKMTEAMLAATMKSAREADPEAAPESGQRREAYYCTDQGCWVAEQYFCDETGCYITADLPLELPDASGKVSEYWPKPSKADKKAVAVEPEKTIVQEGIFAPAVKLTAQVMGRKELNAFRASVIAQHTKVISAFVDTSESRFGQIALKSLFEAADKDGNGTLDKEEVKDALQALGFTFVADKQVDIIFKKADKDKNEVIDFEEFVQEAPKALRTNLVKLAKKNGHDLGFLA
jgi:hypothetical protein